MQKAGGIIAIIAGVFGIVAAIVTLLFGGVAAAVEADGGNAVIGLGWGGVFFSFLVIVLGAIALSAKTKTVGVLLIITSIAGAILGGTIVAIFMALAFIGGILATIGTKSDKTQNVVQAQPHGATLENQPIVDNPKKSKKTYIIVGIIIFWILAATIFKLTNNKDSNGSIKDVKQVSSLDLLISTTPSGIQPDGELAQMFNLNSKHTDLQRENKLNEIKDKVVLWRLKVYEVSKTSNGYKIQTSGEIFDGNEIVSTFVKITPRNDEEVKYIERLLTDDYVTIKGVIKDVSFTRSIEIEPAIVMAREVSDSSAKAIQGKDFEQINIETIVAEEKSNKPVEQGKGSQDCGVLAAAGFACDEVTKTRNLDDGNSQAMVHKGNFKPSFNCAKATLKVEQLICQNQELSILDLQMANEFTGAMSAYDGDELKIDQRSWLKERNECSDNLCIKWAYDKRMMQLQTYIIENAEASIGDNDVSETQFATKLGPFLDCNVIAGSTESLVCSNADLLKLDKEMKRLYRESAKYADLDFLASEKNKWLKQRNNCNTVECIKISYELNISKANDFISSMEDI